MGCQLSAPEPSLTAAHRPLCLLLLQVKEAGGMRERRKDSVLTGCLGKVGGVLEMPGKHGQRALGAKGHRQCAMIYEKP